MPIPSSVPNDQWSTACASRFRRGPAPRLQLLSSLFVMNLEPSRLDNCSTARPRGWNQTSRVVIATWGQLEEIEMRGVLTHLVRILSYAETR